MWPDDEAVIRALENVPISPNDAFMAGVLKHLPRTVFCHNVLQSTSNYHIGTCYLRATDIPRKELMSYYDYAGDEVADVDSCWRPRDDTLVQWIYYPEIRAKDYRPVGYKGRACRIPDESVKDDDRPARVSTIRNRVMRFTIDYSSTAHTWHYRKVKAELENDPEKLPLFNKWVLSCCYGQVTTNDWTHLHQCGTLWRQKTGPHANRPGPHCSELMTLYCSREDADMNICLRFIREELLDNTISSTETSSSEGSSSTDGSSSSEASLSTNRESTIDGDTRLRSMQAICKNKGLIPQWLNICACFFPTGSFDPQQQGDAAFRGTSSVYLPALTAFREKFSDRSQDLSTVFGRVLEFPVCFFPPCGLTEFVGIATGASTGTPCTGIKTSIYMIQCTVENNMSSMGNWTQSSYVNNQQCNIYVNADSAEIASSKSVVGNNTDNNIPSGSTPGTDSAPSGSHHNLTINLPWWWWIVGIGIGLMFLIGVYWWRKRRDNDGNQPHN